MAGNELTQVEIDELVAKYPLPETVADCVMNREEMAEALATSMNTITAWMNAGMPVQQVGGNGRAYELRLSHCFAWRQAQRASEELRTKTAREAIQSMRLALVGGSDGNSIEALPPKERREIIAAQIEDERFRAQRNQLLRRDDVREAIEELLTIIRDTMDAAPDRVERINAMPPKAVEAFIGICDGVIEEVRQKIVRFWELRRENAQPAKRDLFDA